MASPISSPTTSERGPTSSPRSWTADMSSWAKREWNLHARDSRHDRKDPYFPHRRADRTPRRSHVVAQPGTAKMSLTEKPQDLRLSGCGNARDCGGAVQFVREEGARATGCRERATAATDVAGQHRQQRAGVEEPDSGRTRERAAGNDGRHGNRRSG